MPLVTDGATDKYGSISVNPSTMRQIVRKVGETDVPKKKWRIIVNKVSALLFSTSDLVNAKGIKELDQLKVDALQGKFADVNNRIS